MDFVQKVCNYLRKGKFD